MGDTDITSQWQRCDLFAEGEQSEISVPGGPPVRFNTAALNQMRRALEGTGVGPENFVWPPSEDRRRAPYRGWEPFEDIDAGVFFGRDAAIAQGLDALHIMRFRLLATLSGLKSLFVVLGPSGSGKSSFLRAGLIPRLQRDDRRFVVLGIVRPERNALTGDSGLAAAIHDARLALGLTDTTLGEIKNACLHDPDRVGDLLAQVRTAAAKRLSDNGQSGDSMAGQPATLGQEASAPTLLLPLDQAEELFSTDAGEQAGQFLELSARLIRRINAAEVGLIVVATIRTDRYEAMQNHPALDEIGTSIFDELKPMPPTQFKEVIVGPAARATEGGQPLSIAADLVQRLIDDAAAGADTLPLLALTLARLYTDFATGGTLTLADYEAMGGMRDVVNNEIEEILARDSHDRRTALGLLRDAFIPWLVTINRENDRPMRRVARETDLPDTGGLIDAFVAKRLLVRDERDGHVVIEVALESLLRQWGELDGWLRAERQHLKTADDLERSAAAWQTGNHDSAWLLIGTRLADAETIAKTPGFRTRLAGTREYLAACARLRDEQLAAEQERRQAELRRAQERRQAAEDLAAEEQKYSRKLKKWLALVVIVALVAVGAFGWALI